MVKFSEISEIKKRKISMKKYSYFDIIFERIFHKTFSWRQNNIPLLLDSRKPVKHVFSRENHFPLSKQNMENESIFGLGIQQQLMEKMRKIWMMPSLFEHWEIHIYSSEFISPMFQTMSFRTQNSIMNPFYVGRASIFLERLSRCFQNIFPIISVHFIHEV